jgi:hypothetical protein
MASPDGLIEQHGLTWRHLLQATTQTEPSQPATVPTSELKLQPLAATYASSMAVPVLDYQHALPLPPKHSVNLGLQSPPNHVMRAKLGEPRADYDQECRPPTHPRIVSALGTTHVGKTRVTGLRPALESLQLVMREIEHELPDLYPHLGSAGMLCCRQTRLRSGVSNHSWGTAIDIEIDGKAEPYGSNYVYIGLSIIAPFFNRHGWYWGAAYHTPTLITSSAVRRSSRNSRSEFMDLRSTVKFGLVCMILGSICALVARTECLAQGSKESAAACHFLRPRDLATGATVWIGACPNGRADGAGVLRVTRRGEEQHFFFGTMAAGQPTRGLITQDDNDDVVGYRFAGTRAIEPTSRAQIAEIYQAASEGAAAAANYFRERGNAASAKYYEHNSHLLAKGLNGPPE